MNSVSEFNEFEPPPKSVKNRFQLSAGLNLEKLNTVLSEPTIFEPRLKLFKFGLCKIKQFKLIQFKIYSRGLLRNRN